MSGSRRRHKSEEKDKLIATRPRSRERPQDTPVETEARIIRRVRLFFLAFVTVILGARPLFPSEGADLGDGVAVIMSLLGGIVVGMTFLLGRSRLTIRLGWADAAVLLVVLSAIVASIRGALVGTARPAINMAWEWLGYGLIWLLIRQLRLNGRERRLILAGLASIAVGAASYGLYQYLVEFPAMREAYQANREEWLRSLGWDALQTNPTWLGQFENRLYSREPLATFALANSLAGFILPWCVLLLGAFLQSGIIGRSSTHLTDPQNPAEKPRPPGRSQHTRFSLAQLSRLGRLLWPVGTLIPLSLAGVCLVLTKSRSAYLALLIGIIVLLGASRALRQRQWRLARFVVISLLVAATGIAVFLRGLDWAVLSEAGKSLSFRWQYWVATVQMIKDHPLFGCGPGNFRYAYLHYKVPEASEEVSDPHNFVLELTATAGIPAGLIFSMGLLATMGQLVRLGWCGHSGREPVSTVAANAVSENAKERQVSPWTAEILALGAGLLLAWPVGWLFGLLSSAPQTATFILVGCPVAILSLITLWPWIENGQWTPLIALVSLVALSVHWLAAGGLTFPGVAYSFWLLWALAQDVIEETSRAVSTSPNAQPPSHKWTFPWGASTKEVPVSKVGAFAAFGAMAGAGLLCYFTAYAPVLDARGLMAEAARIKAVFPPRAEELLRAAAKADPWAYEPWLRRLELWVNTIAPSDNRDNSPRAKTAATPSAIIQPLWADPTAELDECAVNLLRRAKNHHVVRWNLAIAYQKLAQVTGSADPLHRAIKYAADAIRLYPTQAIYYVGYADMLRQAGRLREARQAAQKALWLHEVTPHQDRKLPDETVTSLNAILKLDPNKETDRQPPP